MKITMQSIRKRVQAMGKLRNQLKMQEDANIDTTKTTELIAHHQRLLDKEKSLVAPFIESLAKSPHLKHFINYYYFTYEQNASNYEKYYDDNLGQPGYSCNACRKAVERAADKWSN